MIETAQIINPKRTKDFGFDSWYSYYAGYSSEFVKTILETAELPNDAVILDPWNGSGTTTTVANRLGYATTGYDLNPVMTIAAKACLVNRLDYSSLTPLAVNIISRARTIHLTKRTDDPISTWLVPSRACDIRKIERSIYSLLIDQRQNTLIADNPNIPISTIAAFFYVALFRTLHTFLAPFKGSNPTWIKVPKSFSRRIRPNADTIYSTFLEEVKTMVGAVSIEHVVVNSNSACQIHVASSCAMPGTNNSIDYIITSPPYCTRIDYAVATMPELTILGYCPKSNFDTLRRTLMGTSTVPKDISRTDENWGNTCNSFLELVRRHDSKASEGYYLKNHLQYFQSVYSSLAEVQRVLKPSGTAVFVVQDSYYKDIHNDLPQIFTEMALGLGLMCVRQENFPLNRNMAKRNPDVKKYRTQVVANESVICFKKQNL